MAEGDKDTTQAELLLQLFKENTLAVAENTKALRALVLQIVGIPPDEQNPEGLIGLMDRLGDIGEAIDNLDQHVVGQNVMLSRINYAFDHMVEVAAGDANATPPVEARAPSLKDLTEALLKFDKELEDEAAKESEPEEPPKPPAKPPMLANAPQDKTHPRMKALPPLPVSAPRPGG